MNIRERLNEIRAHLDAIERELAVGLPWHEAPEWAMWAAMDSDGGWFWYDAEPSINEQIDCISGWRNEGKRAREFVGPEANWTQSKQRRPE